jgi:hypothetical protein
MHYKETEPVRFGFHEVVVGNLLAIVALLAPLALFLACFALFLFGGITEVAAVQVLGILGMLAATVLNLYLFPLWGEVNYFIRALVFHRNLGNTQKGHVCQFSTHPRRYTGVRGFLECADDIGVLSLEVNGLRFHGDHTEVFLPYTEALHVYTKNVGYRGLWLVGDRIRIIPNDTASFSEIEFHERQSYTIPASRRYTREIVAQLREKIASAAPDTAPTHQE